MKKLLLIPICILLLGLSSCKDDSDDSVENLIEQYQLAGTYRAQITPSFMGTTPMTTGEHTIKIEDLKNGTIRLYFDNFKKDPMPFLMTVDIKMKVSKGSGNSLVLVGENGIFRADPPNGGSVNPEDIPSGIQLPEGAEKGMNSSQAQIKGLFGEIEKNGEKALRFDLDLTPGIALPIQILIYTREKIAN